MNISVDPYGGSGAINYFNHHEKSIRNRLTTLRERAVLQKCLSHCGNVTSVLDLPCGTGRFWPVFEARGIDKVIAGDFSAAMLEVATANNTENSRLETRQMDVLALDFPDEEVDVISCMRFFHHLSHAEDRKIALDHLHRVSRSHVLISLWTNGNLQSMRRQIKPDRPVTRGYGRRIVRSRQEIEQEFEAAGFRVQASYAVWPYLSVWRTYVLKKVKE